MEKYHIEFVFGSISVKNLWKMISTAEGLSRWFADDVQIVDDSRYIFSWDKTETGAQLLDKKAQSFIRLKWDDDDEDETYFELSIHRLELTKDITFEITDFADLDEKADAIFLWESQVDTLKRKLGI